MYGGIGYDFLEKSKARGKWSAKIRSIVVTNDPLGSGGCVLLGRADGGYLLFQGDGQLRHLERRLLDLVKWRRRRN